MQHVSHQFSGTTNPQWKIGIVHSTFYKEEIDALITSALTVFKNAGITEENITLYPVPGSFEIPLVGSVLAKEKKVDALIGLGIIVQGDTRHADMLASAVTQGMMDIQVRYHIPFAFEVLYVDSIQQAQERSDKGREAANAVMQSLALISKIT
jgi:6,7-dimethyl-8-ribityllumazine synthase